MITTNGYTGVYDGAAHGATGTAVGVETSPIDLNSLLHLGTNFTNVPGGTADWTFDGNGNYNSTSGTVAITIGQVTLTGAIAGNPTKVYDGNTDASLTAPNFTLANLVGGDNFTVTKTSGAYNTSDVLTASTVTASLAAGDFLPVGSTLAGNYMLPTSVSGPGHITPDPTTTAVDAVSIPYSDNAQSIPLHATVTGSMVNEGGVQFTLKNAANMTIGAPVTSSVSGGDASAMYTVPGTTDVGTYTVLAEYLNTPNFIGSQNTATLIVQPADLAAATAATDADFKSIDGVDALFGVEGKSSTATFKNTNPGTLHWRITYTNLTGVVIDAATGSTLRAIIEVPPMTNCGGVTCSSQVTSAPAWSLKGATGTHVHPDDKTDNMPLTFLYKASGDCSVETSGYVSDLNSIADKAPKCILVKGFAIPKKDRARIDVHLEFRWKGTTGWATNPDPKLFFRTGFAFKATTIATFPVAPSIRTSYQSTGLVMAGQKVTAMGGFVFDQVGMPPAPGYVVRAFNSAADAAALGGACSSSNTLVVGQASVATDGFWYIWKKGSDQGNNAAADLPGKVQYYLQVCNGTTPVSSLATLENKLSDKEFDEVDFRVP